MDMLEKHLSHLADFYLLLLGGLDYNLKKELMPCMNSSITMWVNFQNLEQCRSSVVCIAWNHKFVCRISLGKLTIRPLIPLETLFFNMFTLNCLTAHCRLMRAESHLVRRSTATLLPQSGGFLCGVGTLTLAPFLLHRLSPKGLVISNRGDVRPLVGPGPFQRRSTRFLFLHAVKRAHLIKHEVSGEPQKKASINGSLRIYLMSLDGYCAVTAGGRQQ